MASSSIPDEWFCPISRELMTDPVIGPDGITYERAHIERWLATNSTSPMTREAMPSGSLIPNIALKHTIASYLSANPERIGTSIVAAAAPSFAKHRLEIKPRICGGDLFVDLVPPQTAARQPICFIAILDNSGSMNESASMAEGTETFGFTRMDLTKHAAHTIVETLHDDDMFALVTFSTEARIVLNPTAVNSGNKTRIKTAIDCVQPDASTNIYDGIRKAAQIANHPDLAGRHVVALMMTDGFPNIDPPRGILPTLATLAMTNPWTLHTFGFGYNLDSALLENIAKWGHGLFGFIPDCSMVGTVFINFLAHMLSVVVPNVELKYSLNGGAQQTLNLGPVISGQTRHVRIPRTPSADPAPICTAVIVYEGTEYRAETVDAVPAFVNCYNDFKTLIQNLIQSHGRFDVTAPLIEAFVSKYSASTDAAIQALVRDVQSDTEGEGQIGLAVKIPTNYVRWGAHYMRAYLRSQELQQCMNFKDPGLQIYGGDMFRTIQTDADNIFCTLPPPKPSGHARHSGYGYGGAGAGAAAPPALTSMSVFHNASSGCFHGDNDIRMADGSTKKIKDVKVGDMVATPGASGGARVRYTVECRQRARSQPMTQHGALSITPWHPIRIAGEWKFPAEVAGYSSRPVNVVHNFVLERDHIVIVGDVECCTLGHGIKGAVIEHSYFGDAVLKDLRLKAGGAETGHVVFENLKTVRHPTTDMIVGWIDAP